MGQRQVLAKIQLGLIAAQDIGDDKLATVQVFKIQCNLHLNLIRQFDRPYLNSLEIHHL